MRPAKPLTSTQKLCEIAGDSALLERVSRATSRSSTACTQAYTLFQDNPSHPSLNFKKVHNHEPVYSVRVTRTHRAVGLLENEEITWFWVGDHPDYNRLLRSL